ncbi:hypothetical protein AB1N83_012856 [Pleurotus pulmonarius]
MKWPESMVLRCWDSLKYIIWSTPNVVPSEDEIKRFNECALPFGISYWHIFPPTRTCINPACAHHSSRHAARPLKEPMTYKATLFTLRDGSLPIYTTSLYCHGCHTRYYHNYSIHKQTLTQTYYGGVPNVIQVAQHYFMEACLLELITTGKVFGWLSATNWAHIYNTGLAHLQRYIVNNPTAFSNVAWQSSRSSHSTNWFFLYSLLLDKAEHHWQLILGHDMDSQPKRLTEALMERNHATEGVGQESYGHACNVCCHIFKSDDAKMVKLHAAVCDGIQIGHPCCAVHDCKSLLVSHTAHHCKEHQSLGSVCAVTGCNAVRETGFHTCTIPQHCEAEQAYYEKGTAMFQLRAHLKRAGITVPADSIGASEIEDIPLDDTATNNRGCNNKSSSKSGHIKGSFSHNVTHTQLFFMRPCRIILSQATLFGSEAISAVLQAVHATFPTPESTPEYLFYDTNCKLLAPQHYNHDTHFLHTGQPIDVFHFKSKHKESDVNCQMYCNPAAFLELMQEGKWRLNTSICEQMNIWIGGYQAILQNMEVTRFNFYMDEDHMM